MGCHPYNSNLTDIYPVSNGVVILLSGKNYNNKLSFVCQLVPLVITKIIVLVFFWSSPVVAGLGWWAGRQAGISGPNELLIIHVEGVIAPANKTVAGTERWDWVPCGGRQGREARR